MRNNKLLVMSLCLLLILAINVRVQVRAEVTQEKTSYLVIAETMKAATKVEKLVTDLELVQTSSVQKEKIYAAKMTEKEADILDQDRTISVEPDIVFNATGQTTDKQLSDAIKQLHKEDWASKAIHCENKKAGKDVVKVAVIDSGVDIESDVNITQRIDFVDDYYRNTDGSGHGTAVTHIMATHSTDYGTEGIISANNIELISIRVLDKYNKAPLSRVLEALQWCIENDVDIVNMSFGTNVHVETFYRMIQEVANQNILMIAAVGNQGEQEQKSVQYPARYSQVMGVGAVNERMKRSTFSSYGSGVAVVAPGENIPVSSRLGMVGVGSGTSYAAPYATAIAALLWSIDHTKNAEYVRNALEQGADSLGSVSEYGQGILNYEKSYQLFVTGQVVSGYSDKMFDKIVQEYDVPECVHGSWGYQLHQKLIRPIKINGQQMLYDGDAAAIMAMSYFADQNSEMKEFHVLHARQKTNYVSATKCLYELALNWGGSIKTQAQIENYLDNYVRGGDKTEDVKNLKRIAFVATTKILEDDKIASNLCSTTNASKMTDDQIWYGKRQLLGFAIHIAGDTYAHKSMCVKDKFKAIASKKVANNKTVADYMNTDVATILNEIGKGNLTTAGLGQKFFPKKYQGKCNQYYTDTDAYMSARYNVATANATEHLLKKFVKKEKFTLYTFCPYQKDKKYTYKTKLWNDCMKRVDPQYKTHMSNYSSAELDKLSHE